MSAGGQQLRVELVEVPRSRNRHPVIPPEVGLAMAAECVRATSLYYWEKITALYGPMLTLPLKFSPSFFPGLADWLKIHAGPTWRQDQNDNMQHSGEVEQNTNEANERK